MSHPWARVLKRGLTGVCMSAHPWARLLQRGLMEQPARCALCEPISRHPPRDTWWLQGAAQGASDTRCESSVLVGVVIARYDDLACCCGRCLARLVEMGHPVVVIELWAPLRSSRCV